MSRKWKLALRGLAIVLLAAAWSWLRTGDHYSRNVFERRAGLADGGYREARLRRTRRQRLVSARRTGQPRG